MVEESLRLPEAAAAAPGILEVYNVKTDYGGNIQAAIDACIAGGGGIVYLPPGEYLINDPLDCSAISGTRRGIQLVGAGAGDRGIGTNFGTSRILNATTTGSGAIKAIQTSPSATLPDFQIRDLLIKNVGALSASAYTVDIGGASGPVVVENVCIEGNSQGGNGFRLAVTNGQYLFRSCVVDQFMSGTGFEFSSGNPISSSQSGNGAVVACAANSTKYGFDVSGNNIGISFISCKLVGGGDNAIAYRLRSGTWSCQLIGCHAEMGTASGVVGYQIDNGAHGNYINSFVSGGGAATAGAVVAGQSNRVLLAAGSNASDDKLPIGVLVDAAGSNNEVRCLPVGSVSPFVNHRVDAPASLKNRCGPPGEELAYVELTATKVVNQTSPGVDVIPATTVDCDGTPVEIEFYCPRVDVGTDDGIETILWMDDSPRAIIASCHTAGMTGAGDPVLVRRKLTPAPGPRVFKIMAYNHAAQGAIIAGAGGGDVFAPAYMRVVRA
jgi:hypothetical protein